MTSPMEPTRFKVYSLDKLDLPGPITLDNDTATLIMLRADQVVEVQPLSASEYAVVESLLDNFPDYAPYENILSSVTGKNVERCRRLIEQAEEDGSVDPVLRPVRNLLGRVRVKLHPFGIQIRSMVHTGYMLVPAKSGIRA